MRSGNRSGEQSTASVPQSTSDAVRNHPPNQTPISMITPSSSLKASDLQVSVEDTNPMSESDTDIVPMLLVDEEEYEDDEPYEDIVIMMLSGGTNTTPVVDAPWEVFCKEMIADLKLKKNQSKASMFLTPISGWIAMYPDYIDHVDTPIDLIMIEEKLINRQYESPDEFHEEMNMMIRQLPSVQTA